MPQFPGTIAHMDCKIELGTPHDHHMTFRERKDLGDDNDTLAYIHVQVGIKNSLCQGWPDQIFHPKGPPHLTWVNWSWDTSLLSAGVCLLLE